jgi:aspartate/methionine/tyrosine aminotransferase
MKLANRLQQIDPFHVMDLLAKAKSLQAEGKNIIHLEVGEPDFPSPEPVIQAGQKALAEGKTHYTPAVGLPELRNKVAEFYARRYGQHVDPDQIIITPGASGALQLVTSLLVNPGENLLLTDPGYPCNRHFLANINAEGLLVPTDAEDGYHLTPKQVGEYWTDQTAGVLVASPANPTGAVMSAQQIESLYQAVSDRDGIFIMDEIYHGLTYGLDASTSVGLGENCFVINSFSKYFSMTGWRLGWLVAPKWAIPHLDKLAQNLFLAPSTPAQYGALALFDDECIDLLEQRRTQFSKRLEYLLPELEKLGFKIPAKPQGAFYIYADISDLDHKYNQDSMAFCLDLLETTGLAITPGIDFGRDHGHHFVRFAYTVDVPTLEKAIERLKSYLEL